MVTWHANCVLDEKYNDFVRVRESEKGEIVAVVRGGPNARLVALAPELKELCVELLEALENLGQNHPRFSSELKCWNPDDGLNPCPCSSCKARRVLAKL